MICYSFLRKKKEIGDFIKKINWQLYNNEKLIINNENVLCDYNDKIIKYKEKDGINIINLKEEQYMRENQEYMMQIDFKNNTFKFILKEKNHILNDSLTSSKMVILKDTITMMYKLDEEEKKIIIHLL